MLRFSVRSAARVLTLDEGVGALATGGLAGVTTGSASSHTAAVAGGARLVLGGVLRSGVPPAASMRTAATVSAGLRGRRLAAEWLTHGQDSSLASVVAVGAALGAAAAACASTSAQASCDAGALPAGIRHPELGDVQEAREPSGVDGAVAAAEAPTSRAVVAAPTAEAAPRSVSLARRIGAAVIDQIVILVVLSVSRALFDNFAWIPFDPSTLVALPYVLMRDAWDLSVGKRMLGVRVRHHARTTVNVVRSVVRNALQAAVTVMIARQNPDNDDDRRRSRGLLLTELMVNAVDVVVGTAAALALAARSRTQSTARLRAIDSSGSNDGGRAGASAFHAVRLTDLVTGTQVVDASAVERADATSDAGGRALSGGQVIAFLSQLVSMQFAVQVASSEAAGGARRRDTARSEPAPRDADAAAPSPVVLRAPVRESQWTQALVDGAAMAAALQYGAMPAVQSIRPTADVPQW